MTKPLWKLIAIALFVLTGSPTASFSQVANDNGFTTMLLERVTKDIYPPNVSGVDYSKLQVNTVPFYFSSQPQFEISDLSHFVDHIPAKGAIYTSTPNLFSKQYGLFIKSLAFDKITPAQQKEIDRAKAQYDAEDSKFIPIYAKAERDWKKYQKNTAKDEQWSKDTWMDETGNGTLVSSQVQVRDTVAQNYVSVLAKYGKKRALAQAILNYDSPSARQNVPKRNPGSASGQTTELIYAYGTSPGSIADFVTAAKTVTGAGHSWNYSHVNGWQTTETTSGGGSVGYFGITLSGGGTKTSFSSDEENFGMSIAFQHYARVVITQGNWFTPTLITDNKNGPYQTAEEAQKKLWSLDTGVMPWMPAELVLVYKPVVTIQMSRAKFDKTFTELHAAAGLSFGPFSFGASYGGTKEDIKWDRSSNTLTLQGADCAQVLAVINSNLPDFR